MTRRTARLAVAAAYVLAWPSPFALAGQPFVQVHLRRDGTDLRFFTTLTSLGTPLDLTAQEVRIESYFPADPATERWVRDALD